MNNIPTIEELCLALRYLYYVKAISTVPDHIYDGMEKLALMFAPPSSPLHKVASDSENDYSDQIKNIATTIYRIM